MRDSGLPTLVTLVATILLRLIPSLTDQNLCAHWRNPMDMMRQG